jgi:hypothetical protein
MTTFPDIEAPRGRTMSQSRVSDVALSSNRRWAEDLHAPSGRGFIALLEAFRATGGTVRAEIVGQLLQHHQAGDTVSLAKLINGEQVFGFPWRTSLWIPMFQFDVDDLSLRTGVQRVRAKLPPLWSAWTLASWFAAPNECLHGRSAVDMIDLDLDAVIRAACRLDSNGKTTPPFVRPRREVAARA